MASYQYTIVFNTLDNTYTVGPGHSGEHMVHFDNVDEALNYIKAGFPLPEAPPPEPIEGMSVTEQILKEKEEEKAEQISKEKEKEEEEEQHSKGKKKK